jgi:uncharacterized protein involved in exopolysaccharide biosynthesis
VDPRGDEIDKLKAQLARVNEDVAAHRARHTPNESSEAAPAAVRWIVELETEWTKLNRDVAEARERHRQLEDQQFKASLVATSTLTGSGAQMIVIDPAYRPVHPISRSRSMIAGAAFAASAVLGLIVALSCAWLDDRLYEPFDLGAIQGMALLAYIPGVRRSRTAWLRRGRRSPS